MSDESFQQIGCEFCRKSGKAGEGESVLSKAGAVSDRAEVSARWGKISNKLSSCPLLSVGREGGVEVFSRNLMQCYAALCNAMQCNMLIGRCSRHNNVGTLQSWVPC